MTSQPDLIDFDLIETHKENIQSLPSGRSARALVNILSPQPSAGKPLSPCDNDTKTLNDAIRQEYENEVKSLSDSDDPLDVFDRYVKWTLNAYPSAQATPQSQLLPLLERATKAFLSSPHYKNDPRYLKLWLHYIRFFSDAPRETFAFLARHKIGEGLALFYEEFAAWLEGAGRWNQAEEVYKLGIEREARPTERLMRKFGQFQQRYEQRPQDANEPSSPALPTVRPALAARIDPFASSTPTNDPQAARPNSGIGGSGGGTGSSRSGKPKMAIFSDADGAPSEPPMGAQTKGWESIGSLRDRKKENSIEAKPWVGETLKAGSRKVGHVEKMEIFKDQLSQVQESIPFQSSHPEQAVINPKTGRAERVFVNLEAVYPNINDPTLEMSFEELRAARRGWASKNWSRGRAKGLKEGVGNKQSQYQQPENTIHIGKLSQMDKLAQDLKDKTSLGENATETFSSFDEGKPEKIQKMKKTKIREIKQETQTSKQQREKSEEDELTKKPVKTNLESPTGPKIRRKNSAEPTMTFHSKAATDEIYSIFNQPLKCESEPAKEDTVSVNGESDDEDDDYTSAGESTGTGRISGTTSEFEDEETTNSAKISVASLNENDTRGQSVSGGDGASEWTEFSARRLPNLDGHQSDGYLSETSEGDNGRMHGQSAPSMNRENRDDMESQEGEPGAEELGTPVLLPEVEEASHSTRFIPIPPEDYEAPTHPYRDSYQAAQNRLPFMTPIIEKTESSLAPSTAAPLTQPKDYFNVKTPSRLNNSGAATSILNNDMNDLLLSSPFQEVVTPEKNSKTKADTKENEGSPAKKLKLVIATSPQGKASKGPVIKDLQVNPCDETVRSTITKSLYPPLSSYPGFHNHESECSNRSNEIRKYVKHTNERKSRGNAERTQTQMMPPVLRLPGSSKVYAIRRELGKGAFAPVYLVDSMNSEEEEDGESENGELAALKMEDPPTSWEFIILRTLHSRLGSSSRTVQSLIQAHECHLYRDECFLVLDYSDQGTLLDLVNLFRVDNIRNGKSSDTGIDEPLAMFFAIELFRVIEESHRAGIIHGDLKADNCLVRLDQGTSLDGPFNPDGRDGWSNKGFTLIDFGRGIDMRKFRPEAQFIADWETGPQDCTEMRELRPWTWQADYFGLAGIIHSLLFGKYIETVVDKSAAVNAAGLGGPVGGLGAKKVWKLREGFKRYWQGNIWNEVFWILLNPTIVPLEGGMNGELEKMPIHKSMKKAREMMEAWLMEEGERKGLRNLIGKAERMIKEGRRK